MQVSLDSEFRKTVDEPIIDILRLFSVCFLLAFFEFVEKDSLDFQSSQVVRYISLSKLVISYPFVRQLALNYRVSHSKVGKLILLWYGYRF